LNAVLAIAKLVIKEIFRKKDFYVALILTGVILCYAAGLKFYNVSNAVRYLMEIGLMLIFLFSVILTAALAARQYPSEIQNRTIQVLLAKPVSRIQFVAGKFLGAFFAGTMCFVIFYVLFMAVTKTKAEEFSFILAFQTFYLFLLNLLVLSAMACGFSYYLTTSANVSITLVLYLLISTYGPGLKGASDKLFWINRYLGEAFYYVLPHFEFFDLRQRFIHHWSPLSANLVITLTLYALTYASFFLWLGWLKFRKQTL